MRLVTCSECGKHYDYDKDDFCPKCGVYNPPNRQPQRQAALAQTGARPNRSYAAQTKRDPYAAARQHTGKQNQEKKGLSISQIVIFLVVLYFIASFFLPLFSLFF